MRTLMAQCWNQHDGFLEEELTRTIVLRDFDEPFVVSKDCVQTSHATSNKYITCDFLGYVNVTTIAVGVKTVHGYKVVYADPSYTYPIQGMLEFSSWRISFKGKFLYVDTGMVEPLAIDFFFKFFGIDSSTIVDSLIVCERTTFPPQYYYADVRSVYLGGLPSRESLSHCKATKLVEFRK